MKVAPFASNSDKELAGLARTPFSASEVVRLEFIKL
jgi:hypothetical protein